MPLRLSTTVALATILLTAGCATRPPSQRAWSVSTADGQTSLAYGQRNLRRADFSVICDRQAGVADLIYPVGNVPGVVRGARTELLIAPDDDHVDTLPAEVGIDPSGAGLTIVARTVIPPAPVAAWVGKQLVVGAVGQASMLVVPPDRRTITAFLKACRR